MKPYFETKLGKLYNCDCLEFMKIMEDKSVDLVLTDPPYGMNYQSHGRKQQFEKIENDNVLFTNWITNRISTRYVVFCRWDLMNVWKEALVSVKLDVNGCIVWNKAGGGMGDLKRAYALDYELILYSSPQEWRIPGKRYGSVWKCLCDASSLYRHPTQKPVGIVSMCIERFSSGNELILDPFLGSGTTAVACEKLKRKWIGIEISEKYCEISAKRIANESNQTKLF